MNIVLIETSGNQRYIFATNKLRENVGASELTYRVGKEFVVEAINNETERGSTVEKIIATSGKALVLVDSIESGKRIIKEITARALKEMPGITVHGAISDDLQDDLSDINDKVKQVHEKHERLRYQMPGNEQRFLRLPFVAPCDTSGLPAQREGQFEEARKKLYSQVSYVKADNKMSGQKRIQQLLKRDDLIDPLRIYEREWLAIIHADGNGLGAIFQNFKVNSQKNGHDYLEAYRQFSEGLDNCTAKATNHALNELKKQLGEDELPVVPLVLGGDDLTVICDGKYALKFTHDFLKQFEKETESSDLIRAIAANAFGKSYLGICAGIAIIKPHFPFHQAYELAEQLLKSAKHVKEKIKHVAKVRTDNGEEEKKVQLPSSALDFHILYDSAHSDLKVIREKLTKEDGKTELFSKPYIVTDEKELSSADDESKSWAENHSFGKLNGRVNAMCAKDEDGRRKLPNSQLHFVREALFLGRKETDARVNLIAHRYEAESKEKEQNFSQLFKGTDELFFDETRKDNGKEYIVHATHFMDALDVVEFWKGFPETRQSNGTEKQDNE
jgi:hypothetical protein